MLQINREKNTELSINKTGGGQLPSLSMDHQCVYVGPPGPIPRMMSSSFKRLVEYEEGKHWSAIVTLDGELQTTCVGASVEGRWVARYARGLFSSKEEAEKSGINVLTMTRRRAVELVFGEVELNCGILGIWE